MPPRHIPSLSDILIGLSNFAFLHSLHGCHLTLLMHYRNLSNAHSRVLLLIVEFKFIGILMPDFAYGFAPPLRLIVY